MFQVDDFGLLSVFSSSFLLACSRTRWFVADLSRCLGRYPRIRLSPRCWNASNLLRSAGESWSDSRPYRIFAPAMALTSRSSHVGVVLLVQKYCRAVIVASVEVILAFKSGLLDVISSSEIPRYCATATLLRYVPSSKWVCECQCMVMARHF